MSFERPRRSATDTLENLRSSWAQWMAAVAGVPDDALGSIGPFDSAGRRTQSWNNEETQQVAASGPSVMFSSFCLSLSPSSLCGGALRRVGGTSERRKRGRRTVLDGLRKLFVGGSWHSGRCRRISRSSVSAEVQAAGEAQEEEEHVRLVIGDLLFQDGVERKRADRTLARGLGLQVIV